MSRTLFYAKYLLFSILRAFSAIFTLRVEDPFKASPLMKPFLTPGGWQEVKCVYWKVSVGLKCVCTSRMDSLLNLPHLYTHVSRKVIYVSEISAVNFMVG